MKKLLHVFSLAVASLILISGSYFSAASALSFQQNRIIDDVVFNNSGTMTPGSINDFLNRFGSSCISPNRGFTAPDPTGYTPSGGYSFGGNASAGQIIYDAARAYDLNPQVLLVTLEKEQSLVTGSVGCSTLRYAAAVGYACPDGGTTYNYSNVDLYTINGNTVTTVNGTCVNSAAKVGFAQQIIRAAWLLKFGEQRSEGNVSWAVVKPNWDNSDDPQSCYGGPMTQGTWARCPSGGSTYYDGYRTIDGTSVHIDNGATASLYWYTPHFHGNQNFFDLFLSWFGSPFSGVCLSSLNTTKSDVLFDSPRHKAAVGNFMIYSGASTNCVEFHAWDNHLSGWASHNASNSASIDPANSEIAFADLNGSGKAVPILVGLTGTGSGMVEFHIWNSDLQTWSQHITSNQPVINPAISKIVFADTDGDGKDEAILIGDANGSTSTGNIEFHVWNPGFNSWRDHIVSNSHTLDPAVSTVEFGNLDGSGKDTGILIGQGNGSTSTGNIEFHVWNPGFNSWRDHIVSNSHTLDPAVSKVTFADLDGDGKDEGMLIGLRPPTGSGNIEFHIWNPWFGSWKQHIISNQQASS